MRKQPKKHSKKKKKSHSCLKKEKSKQNSESRLMKDPEIAESNEIEPSGDSSTPSHSPLTVTSLSPSPSPATASSSTSSSCDRPTTYQQSLSHRDRIKSVHIPRNEIEENWSKAISNLLAIGPVQAEFETKDKKSEEATEQSSKCLGEKLVTSATYTPLNVKTRNNSEASSSGETSSPAPSPSSGSSSTSSSNNLKRSYVQVVSLGKHLHVRPPRNILKDHVKSVDSPIEDALDKAIKNLQAIGPLFNDQPRDTKKEICYETCRKAASDLWTTYKSYVQKAEDEDNDGNFEKANKYKEKARLIKKKAHKQDIIDDTTLFDSRNKKIKNIIEFDVHCLGKKRALNAVKFEIWCSIQGRTVSQFKVIIGKGGGDGPPKLKDEVLKFLKLEKINRWSEGDGDVCFKLDETKREIDYTYNP